MHEGRWRPNRQMVLASLVVGLAYALLVSSTTPFTWQADTSVAAPLALAVVGAMRWWPLRTTSIGPKHRIEHPYRRWVLLVVIVAAWELYCYVAAGSRAEHPTFSSMVDAIDRYEVLKALVVLAWLSLGWMII